MIDKIKNNICYILMLLQPFLDIVAYFQYDNFIGSLAGYFRMFVLIALPLYVLFLTKKKSFFLWNGAIVLFCLLHIINSFRVGYVSIVEDVSYLARVVQMPVLTISFIYYFEYMNKNPKDSFIKVLSINILTIFISMILAFISNTGVYTYDIYKFGYTGWFANANSQSIIIVSLVPILLYYAMYKQKIIWVVLASSFSWIMLLINGTKAAYYAVFVIFLGFSLFLMLDFILNKRKFNVLISMLLIFLCFSTTVIKTYTPRYKMDNYANSKRNEEQEEINMHISQNDVEAISWKEMLDDEELYKLNVEIYRPYLDKNIVEQFGEKRLLEAYDTWPTSSVLADSRLRKRIVANFIWEESDVLTKCLGFEFTKMYVNNQSYDLENDYSAIYYYYGYIGFGLYIVFILSFLIMVLKKTLFHFKDAFNLFNFTLILILGLQLGLAQFSGAILRRPNASIYLSVILCLIYFACKKDKLSIKVINNEK